MGLGRRRIVTDVASVDQFGDLLKVHQPPTLVFYTASWCTPCRTIDPYIKELSDRLGKRLRVLRVDVDANADIAKQHSISAVPYFTFHRGGHLVERMMGCGSDAVIEASERHVAIEEADKER